MEVLYCEPFLHVYRKYFWNPQSVEGKYHLPITDLSVTKAGIPFYVASGDGFIILGNEIEHKSISFGPDNLFLAPAGVGDISDQQLWLIL